MEISGKVVDIDNVPLMGANITLRSGLKSGKVGTSTNFDGDFVLDSDEFAESDEFEVSFIGFASQKFTAKQLQNKKITLQESVNSLDEIVLVGTKPNKSNSSNNTNKVKEHFTKNKFVYAGASGLLGLALLLISIKKIK